jgi:hypothetical protein
MIVSLNDSHVNHLSIHAWEINYTNSAIRTTFTLSFPSCVNLDDVSSVDDIQANQSISDFNRSNFNPNSTSLSYITFNALFQNNETNYKFNVLNVTNCYYSVTFNSLQFLVQNDYDKNSETLGSTTPFLTYDPGLLSDCNIGFDKNISETNSTLTISFTVENSIKSNSFIFDMVFDNFYASTFSLISGISLPINCSGAIKDVPLNTNVSNKSL